MKTGIVVDGVLEYGKDVSFGGEDLRQKKFGRLTPICLNVERKEMGGSKATYWNCACECDADMKNIKVVVAGALKSGITKSCGCLRNERVKEATGTHGMSRHPFYETYLKMHKRCYNSKSEDYRHYGARGIFVAPDWHSFDNFKRDMFDTWKTELSIGRQDNDGPYSKDNCRWENDFEQANNRRNNRLVTCRGETRTVAKWAAESAVAYTTIIARLDLGWSAEDAIFEPLHKNQFG